MSSKRLKLQNELKAVFLLKIAFFFSTIQIKNFKTMNFLLIVSALSMNNTIPAI